MLTFFMRFVIHFFNAYIRIIALVSKWIAWNGAHIELRCFTKRARYAEIALSEINFSFLNPIDTKTYTCHDFQLCNERWKFACGKACKQP